MNVGWMMSEQQYHHHILLFRDYCQDWGSVLWVVSAWLYRRGAVSSVFVISLVDCLRYALWYNACLITINFLSLVRLWRGFFFFFSRIEFFLIAFPNRRLYYDYAHLTDGKIDHRDRCTAGKWQSRKWIRWSGGHHLTPLLSYALSCGLSLFHEGVIIVYPHPFNPKMMVHCCTEWIIDE